MPVMSLECFIDQLAESGLFASEELADYLESFPKEKRPKDAVTLARELIRDERLTPCQAEMILAGRANLLQLGDYVLLERIGKGGMGEVFKAIHRRLQRLVAIKLLREPFAGEGATRRFCQEIQAAARLNHPNIVATHDAGERGGVLYLAMEYVEGTDLATIVHQRGPLPLPQALTYVLQAARGLEYAHQRGVIHRDIKPANLLLDAQGTVKILDMGLARIADSELRAGVTLAERLTRTGQMLGTVDYVSPEQAADARLADRRSDIYSLGCTLFMLLTRRAVYEGETPIAKLIAHSEAPIPKLRMACPQAPARLERIFETMVAKDPNHRYATMIEVAQALETAISELPVLAESPPSPAPHVDEVPPASTSLSQPHKGCSKALFGCATASSTTQLEEPTLRDRTKDNDRADTVPDRLRDDRP